MPSDCLVYVLDVAATLAQNQVVIDLARRQRKTTGEWGPLRPWYYAPHAAHVKYDPEDRLILALLDEAQGVIGAWGVFLHSSSGAGSAIGPGPMERAQEEVYGQGASMGRRDRPEQQPSDRCVACAGSCFGRTRRLGRAAGANRAAASAPHRGRGRSADRALG